MGEVQENGVEKQERQRKMDTHMSQILLEDWVWTEGGNELVRHKWKMRINWKQWI